MATLYYTTATGTDSSFVEVFSHGVHDLYCEQVDMSEYYTMSGKDFNNINPNGCVPCLVLVDGNILEDRHEILSYIEEHHTYPQYESQENSEHGAKYTRMYSVLQMVKSLIPHRPKSPKSLIRSMKRSFSL